MPSFLYGEIMPYSSTSDLPDSVKNVLPRYAQEIYKEAFNSAYEDYKKAEDWRGGDDREEVAYKVAWAAVKKKYKKGADEKWHTKE